MSHPNEYHDYWNHAIDGMHTHLWDTIDGMPCPHSNNDWKQAWASDCFTCIAEAMALYWQGREVTPDLHGDNNG